MKKLNIKAIRIDGGTQSRVEINGEAVSEYADALAAGASFPPVVTFFDGVDHWLADGFHRFHALNKVGAASIDADVRHGTQRDAMLFSFGANGTHGQRRTNADKRKAVSSMLADAEWATWSDRKIAEACEVTHPFVAAIRTPKVVTVTTQPTKEPIQNTASTAIDLPKDSTKSADAVVTVTTSPHDDGAPDAAEMAALAMAEQSDREAMEKLLYADDKLATAYTEIKRLNAELAKMRISRDGYMNKCNEASALVKKRDRQISAMESAQREAVA